jgi:protein TIF31
LSEVQELKSGADVILVEDPYTEKDARAHVIRVRDLIGAAADRPDTVNGICAGISLHDSITAQAQANGNNQESNGANQTANPVSGYDFEAPPSIQTIIPPREDPAPKTVKSLCVSPWNPPPHSLRQKGHLLYLQLTTNEGEQFQITAHISGFFVNKSSNAKFDPFPRPSPKAASAHSLLSLIAKLSPSFDSNFKSLQEYNSRRDPLINFQFTNILPPSPWLVSPADAALTAHQPDMTRTQESYLITGLENAETLRDWNEEIQGARELPKENIQDRVFRERYLSRTFADYTDAAVRGAVLVAKGEVPPLNPTEGRDAQIFIYNNIFYSFGADGAEIFTSEGGDSAARVAVGKDVAGVKLVNQLDIEGLHTPGTVIVDYLGMRIVCQSIVPGIFKPREPGEHQVDYGGVEGRDTIADNEAFVSTFAQLSKSLRVKKHDVWDKEGKKHTLEGSVETKGLLGTDGRKYVLDLYRLTPPDVKWLEEYWRDTPTEEKSTEADYPHRMAVLRPELVEMYWRMKLSEWVQAEVGKKKTIKDSEPSKTTSGEAISEDANGNSDADKHERVDISGFQLAFNPDVFSGQVPQTEEEKQEMDRDEEQVRDVCRYLRETAIPELVSLPMINMINAYNI